MQPVIEKNHIGFEQRFPPGLEQIIGSGTCYDKLLVLEHSTTNYWFWNMLRQIIGSGTCYDKLLVLEHATTNYFKFLITTVTPLILDEEGC